MLRKTNLLNYIMVIYCSNTRYVFQNLFEIPLFLKHTDRCTCTQSYSNKNVPQSHRRTVTFYAKLLSLQTHLQPG